MARKDLIEALQELEKRRRSSEEAVVPAAPEVPEPAAAEQPVPQPVPQPADEPAEIGGRRLERVVDEPREEPRPAHERSRTGQVDLMPLTRPLVIAVVALAFAFGFLLGSRGRSVQATPAGEAGSVATLPPSTAQGAASAPAPVDSLTNPANQFTIQAITYDNTDRALAFARETVRHFRAGGLPAHEPLPTPNGRNLVVLVGAAPDRADLDGLRAEVRAMSAPNGDGGQFATAEILPISAYLPD